MPSPRKPNLLLFIIVLSQFAGTSLWFLGNAVIDDLAKVLGSPINIAFVTSIVQGGFIAGTLVFALLTIADRFKSTHVFLLCSAIAALFNISILWLAKDVTSLSFLRFFTGFFLAGIYPIGMKISADIFSKKLGNALGFLVGALVIGTSFPHLLKSGLIRIPFNYIIIFSSLLALIGGLLMYAFIPATKSTSLTPINYKSILPLFKLPRFRSAAFGYFGHMWELYAFWAFVPFALQLHNILLHAQLDISLWSFFIIGFGAIGCVTGGQLSQKWGSRKVATLSLAVSGICCLISPLFLEVSTPLFLCLLFTWSFFVIADSPQFSALVAQSVQPETKGTALTFVTCAGFAITIVSIQLLQTLTILFSFHAFWLLAFGPVMGVFLLSYRESANRLEA
jgi:MFS family permease